MNPTGGGAAPLSCPTCGAPAHVQPGQTLVTCPYCQRSFELPAAAAPQPQVVERIVVVEPPAFSPPTAGVGPRRRGTGCSVFGFIPLLGMAIAGYSVYHAVNATSPTSALPLPGPLSTLVHPWDGRSPLVCRNNQDIDVHDVHATFPSGSAIDAADNCHVTCTRCTLNAPVAIEAADNAEVDLVDSRVEGSAQAIVADGNATVKLTGDSSLTGRVVKRSGNAQVVVPPRAAPATAPTTPHASPAPHRTGR